LKRQIKNIKRKNIKKHTENNAGGEPLLRDSGLIEISINSA
jgi:hypothetical protein